jgi:oxygen-independent coproporphyrinogen-3 oxidase
MAETLAPAVRRAAEAHLPEALLRRFDTPGPRYTSYPTADRFHARFGANEAAAALRACAANAAPLSLYVHVPFCESVCWYCACNKVVTKHHERAAEYLAALDAEIALVSGPLGACRQVSQLHLGGGSPTFLSDDELAHLMATLRGAFDLADAAEVSIEVDPRTVTPARLAALRALGFNRLSFGVQDFDAEVQAAVHRVQPYERVRELIEAARALGYASINADLIYGLPRQTPSSFARTVAQIGALRPDRIALYAYAHLPERFKPQRRIPIEALPDAGARVAMLGGAIAGFLARGYAYIGMDHFALAGDPLAVARREGRLHRNFQGYSTQPDCDLIGLGVSAIGKLGASYNQNTKSLPDYYAALREGRLPVERGITLDADDLLRRDAIMALMCQGRLDLGALGAAHAVDAAAYFADALLALVPHAAAGLVARDGAAIQVTARGWYVVRAIAALFDRHLRDAGLRERYSRIV